MTLTVSFFACLYDDIGACCASSFSMFHPPRSSYQTIQLRKEICAELGFKFKTVACLEHNSAKRKFLMQNYGPDISTLSEQIAHFCSSVQCAA